MLKVQLEARLLGSTGEWSIRSRMSEDNYSYRSGHLTVEQLIVKTETIRHRWMQSDFTHEFRIGVYSMLENGSEVDISTFANSREKNRLKHAARGLVVVA